MKWLRKSAEQGYVPAEYIVGLAYTVGSGIPEDGNEALKWLNKAANDGSANAMFTLASVYEGAKWGVPQDHEKAEKLRRQSAGPLQAAAANGDVEAQSNLADAYYKGLGVNKDTAQSFKWRLQAAENGCPMGQAYLGHAYKDGLGVPKNDVKAVQWFQKAAEHGIKIAQYELGQAYNNGEGVTKNATKAYMWFDLALIQGSREAGPLMIKLSKSMTPAQIQQAMKASHDWQTEHLAHPPS